MTSNVNKSVYRSIEAKWKKLAKDGKTVNVEIKPIYATNDVERPSWFNIKYECDDLKVVENIENTWFFNILIMKTLQWTQSFLIIVRLWIMLLSFSLYQENDSNITLFFIMNYPEFPDSS